MDGADGRFLDQIRDSERRAICVRAAGSGHAERAAPPAPEPRNEALGGYGKGVDRVLADRGQACRQTGRGETAGRLLPDPGDQLLPGLLYPIPDDGVSEHPDPSGRDGGGVHYEAAGEAVTQVRREQSEKLRDGVGVATDDEPLRPGADGLSEDTGGVVKVMVGEFGDPFVDPIGLQAVPAAVSRAAHACCR